MDKLRVRFIVSHILPILLVAPLITVFLLYLLETQVLLSGLSQGLNEQARLIVEASYGAPGLWSDSEQAQDFTRRISLHTRGRVILLLPNGVLLASSAETDQPMIGQVIQMEGMEQARGGQTASKVVYTWAEQEAEIIAPVWNAQQQVVGMVGVSQKLAGAATQFDRLRRLTFWVVGAELLLGMGLGFLLAVRLERPIRQAALAVVDIADGGRADPVPEAGPYEIRQLARAVNSLAEQLHMLEDTRRRLLANVVHELGRPLGAIRSAVHVLRGAAGEDRAVRAEFLQGVEEEIERMQPLLDDLAQVHSQGAAGRELDLQPVDLGPWLAAQIAAWQAPAQEKGLALRSELPDALPTVQINPDRMGQVIGNLLSNAVKYTPAGGWVQVEAGARAAEAWIAVRDNGPGIAEAERSRVFEPFYRSQAAQRFPQGLGLGLTIARALTEAHGGRLTLESRPGEGSVFTVWLPLAS